MGLMKQAYDTYCTLEAKYCGVYGLEKEPLVPVSHQIAKAEIEITLNADGQLLDARQVGKDEAAIIMPVTEASAGRTGDTSCAHPLCDQIRFLSPKYPQKYEAYLTQLHEWENSPYGHPKLHAVARYVEKGTILEDMERLGIFTRDKDGLAPQKGKQVVCWRVDSGKIDEVTACWKDRTLFRAFIDYYASTKQEKPVFCMVSGEYAPPANQHPKKIININGCANAKLVSANDSTGFTYRGRFTDERQAMTMSYAASQKIHSALHWLAANQGVSIGGRMFLCWNPKGIALPKPHTALLQRSKEKQIKYSDYHKTLSETLRGWRTTIPEDADAVVASFDAATSGRLSLTYYSELLAGDFLERLYNWDLVCCWEHFPFGIQSPPLNQIANCAYGTQRVSNGQARLETDDRILRQQVQRLFICRVDKGKIPADIVQALIAKASNLQILERNVREEVLSTTCAMIRKYHFDWYKEELKMALEPEKQDVSYQYGRLLAVFEKIERDTYGPDETREPNAIRMQSVFSKRPQYASRILWEQLKKAYYPKLKPGARIRYDRLIGEIVAQISDCSQGTREEPLKDTYFIGYYLQRTALYTSQNNTENKQEEEV